MSKQCGYKEQRVTADKLATERNFRINRNKKALRCKTCAGKSATFANIIFCGTCFTLEHNGHLFTNEEIVDSSTKQASLASLCMPDNDAETLRTSIREAFISIIDEKITENFETLKGAFESMEVSKKRVQDDRSMTTSELEWNVEVIRKLTSTAERELERIEMWKERVLNAILTSNSE
ncbi:hypothetical protein QR680_004256 [Steinernema hermaphroditum]|uniref:Uncharacterized protein n=1 Tax=Steinernema hermaphroditum TaxID=289476 RepID=A0AA39LTP4_9BILA|nr:hypothetical protein QR680_004256 [Steinernema hermaphroditum]